MLKLHIRKHTGEKPFRCLLCIDDEVGFSQLAHLKTHMKKIHKQSKPYLCEGCHEFFKIKVELEAHQCECERYQSSLSASTSNSHPEAGANNEEHSNESAAKLSGSLGKKNDDEMQILSDMRFHVAILLKKISAEQKLQKLGFEKRLIDNVVISSLKLAKRTTHTDPKLTPLDRMRLNITELLDWIVPSALMQQMRQENSAIEAILEKLVATCIKQK